MLFESRSLGPEAKPTVAPLSPPVACALDLPCWWPVAVRCIINAVHKDLVSHALRMQPRKVGREPNEGTSRGETKENQQKTCLGRRMSNGNQHKSTTFRMENSHFEPFLDGFRLQNREYRHGKPGHRLEAFLVDDRKSRQTVKRVRGTEDRALRQTPRGRFKHQMQDGEEEKSLVTSPIWPISSRFSNVLRGSRRF